MENVFALKTPSALEGELREAKRYLPGAAAADLEAFAERQLHARRRLTQLLTFYRDAPCHMARTHLLAACAIMLGRFCGFSAGFDAIGEALMPLTPDGVLRTADWEAYAGACKAGLPWQTREELWLAAHMADMERIQREKLDEAFAREADLHRDDPTWQLLRQHMEVTSGVRRMDAAALTGMVAYETAMAQTMAASLHRLLHAGGKLLGRYAWETARAIALPFCEPENSLIGYRRCALELLRCTATAWTASKVYRRGVRQRDRGRRASDDGWPLLAEILGERVGEIHPLIVRFYQNPSNFDVKASVHLHTLPARMLSWAATLLTGQGFYESNIEDIETQFRVYRRVDGSMHFLRELYFGNTLRTFDSDFVVRSVEGCPTLSEVFTDLKTEVEMEVMPQEGGSLSIRGRHIRVRGIRLPSFGLTVEFQSRVLEEDGAAPTLLIEGALKLLPRTRLGRFLVYRILNRPMVPGSIRYTATPN